MKKLQLELKKQFDIDFTSSKSTRLSSHKILLDLPDSKYLVLESTEDKLKSYNKVVSYLSDKGFVKQEIIKTKTGNEYIQYEDEFITVYKLSIEDFPIVDSMSEKDFDSILNLVSGIHTNSVALANLVFNNSEYSIDTSFVELYRRIEATEFTLKSDKINDRLQNKFKFHIQQHTFDLLKAHSINIEDVTQQGAKVLNTFIEKQNMVNCDGNFALILSEDCTVGSPIFDFAKVVVSSFAINKFKNLDLYITAAKSSYSEKYQSQADSMYFDLMVDYFLLETLGKIMFAEEDKDIENLLHSLCNRGIGCWG